MPITVLKTRRLKNGGPGGGGGGGSSSRRRGPIQTDDDDDIRDVEEEVVCRVEDGESSEDGCEIGCKVSKQHKVASTLVSKKYTTTTHISLTFLFSDQAFPPVHFRQLHTVCRFVSPLTFGNWRLVRCGSPPVLHPGNLGGGRVTSIDSIPRCLTTGGQKHMIN